MLLGSLNYGAARLRAHISRRARRARDDAPSPEQFARDDRSVRGARLCSPANAHRLQIANEADVPRDELELARSGHSVAPGRPWRKQNAAARRRPHRGGFVALERFAIATYHPGRLFRAWTRVHMDALARASTTGAGGPAVAAELGRQRITRSACRGDADFAGLTANPSDPPQHIAWKAYGAIGRRSSSFPRATTNRSGSSGTPRRSSTSKRGSRNSRAGVLTRRSKSAASVYAPRHDRRARKLSMSNRRGPSARSRCPVRRSECHGHESATAARPRPAGRGHCLGASLPHSLGLLLWISALLITCITWRLAAAFAGRPLPPISLRLLLWLLLVSACLQTTG